MIKAKHNKTAEFIYRQYISWLLKSNFKKFILVNKIPDLTNCIGLIVTPNHFSWWDGFFIDYAMRRFANRKPFVMMMEEQLKKYRFFPYVGAFSIDEQSLISIKESIGYAKHIIKSPANYLIFYPQGKIQNSNADNIEFKRGLVSLIENENACILTIYFRINYWTEKKPYVYCRFGNVFKPQDIILNFENYKKRFKENIDELNKYIHNGNETDLFKL